MIYDTEQTDKLIYTLTSQRAPKTGFHVTRLKNIFGKVQHQIDLFNWLCKYERVCSLNTTIKCDDFYVNVEISFHEKRKHSYIMIWFIRLLHVWGFR